ncbi:hypothetical protein FACS1894125_3670 [Actinomycetota bacterium]|nr:hypothetical protein FACS1894125_3670 [Actinomycetota bacterium]
MQIYNSKTHATQIFEPLVDGIVSIYVCGPTVQSSPHIGHMRVAVCFDVIRRYFEARGFNVQFVQNVPVCA